MKREILFRGKHKNTHTWVDGSYIKEIDPYDKTVKHYIMSGNKFSMHEVDPATVGQYTGLTDKNGVKIFEGDVTQADGLRCIIEWRGVGKWCAVWNDKRGNTMYPDISFRFHEVTGNIHDK